MGTIITNGLRGCWDAGTSLSYPGSGTTWNDLVGSANATFDGATYSAFNGGSVLFDSDKVTVADTTTCLLYTSPSPRDLSTSRMPSSA